MVNNLAFLNETSSESRNFLANILCKFVSKYGMDFLCKEFFAAAKDDEDDDTKFKEIGVDSLGIATFVTVEAALDWVGDEGTEKLVKSSSLSANLALHVVAISSTLSFSSNVKV